MMTWNACMLREIQPWLVVGLTYISCIDVKHLQLKHAWLLAQVLHALVALLIVKHQYKCSNYYVYIGATLFFLQLLFLYSIQ
jgi:hypothetical protein